MSDVVARVASARRVPTAVATLPPLPTPPDHRAQVVAVAYGQVPWLGLSLSGTFATYALLRKMARVESLPGSSPATCREGWRLRIFHFLMR